MAIADPKQAWPESAPSKDPKLTPGSYKLLVVDEDAEVCEVIEELLVDRGFEVRLAADSQNALRELAASSFDGMLCHTAVLRASGGRLTQSCRALEPKLRIVAMSAGGVRAGSDEADANLAKPFTRAELLAALTPDQPLGGGTEGLGGGTEAPYAVGR